MLNHLPFFSSPLGDFAETRRRIPLRLGLRSLNYSGVGGNCGLQPAELHLKETEIRP